MTGRVNEINHGERPMTIDVKQLRFLLAGALLLGAAACGGTEADAAAAGQESGQDSGPAAPAARVINVEVAEVGTETFRERVRLTGVVEANRDVMVSAEESGAVVELMVDKGAQVEAGTPLVRIDDRILRAQVEQAEAQAELAEETWQRRKRLWEEQQVGSELAYLEARATARQTAANLETLRQRLERTVIRAPIDGIVDARMVELGSLLAPGTQVMRVVDVTPLKILAGVPERYALDVRTGASGTVTFDVFPDEVFSGRVNFVGTVVDQQSRTFPVELTIPNQRGVIKPQMIANVAVDRNEIENAVVVPQNAIIRKEEGYVVYVADGETARAVPVELGPSQSNRVVIEAGLEPGARLIVVGQQTVADGDRIRIVGEG